MQLFTGLFFALGLSFCLTVGAVPYVQWDSVLLKNGYDAVSLNTKFRTLNTFSPCEAGEVACVDDQVARCVGGHFMLTRCDAGLVCRASPKVDSPGTTVDCITESEKPSRILTTRQIVPPNDTSQSSLSLDGSIIANGFQNNGQANITFPGQTPSRTSGNNYINFCKTVNAALTNGQQVASGSCNSAPIGVIPSTENMPSSKFIFPPNFAVLTQTTTFTVRVAISHLQTGVFTNVDSTYMAAPVEVNTSGDVIGHSHIVIQQLSGFGQTTPMDPKTFVFFKAINDAAVNGVLALDVTGGLPAGYYRIATFHSGANHQPIALPVSQRGPMGDMVYFSVL